MLSTASPSINIKTSPPKRTRKKQSPRHVRADRPMSMSQMECEINKCEIENNATRESLRQMSTAVEVRKLLLAQTIQTKKKFKTFHDEAHLVHTKMQKLNAMRDAAMKATNHMVAAHQTDITNLQDNLIVFSQELLSLSLGEVRASRSSFTKWLSMFIHRLNDISMTGEQRRAKNASKENPPETKETVIHSDKEQFESTTIRQSTSNDSNSIPGDQCMFIVMYPLFVILLLLLKGAAL